MAKQIHPSAFVEEGVTIGEDVSIWHFVHIRKGAKIGPSVSIGKDVYIDSEVNIGEGTRIQNSVNVYNGVEVGRWCFVGPAVVFTNDQIPRVGRKSWQVTKTFLEDGCSLGAGCIIRCGVTVGGFALVGAGAVVTKDIPPFCLVTGLPAEVTHRICACGDTTLPLIAWLDDLVRPCCRHNLQKPVLNAAVKKIEELKRTSKLAG
jgi:UDP-2-acetamido-3-amino-2,3-dideoxy-glucuronate N-acetyltransferase